MKLLTVRLRPEDAQRIAELRERGVKIADLVRDAIARESWPPVRKIKTAADAKRVLEEIYSKYPDPPGRRRVKLDLTDRKIVARAIRARLKRRKKS
jgi:hypothetical protein